MLYWHFVVMPKYTIGVHGLSSWGLASEVDMEHVMARGFRLIDTLYIAQHGTARSGLRRGADITVLRALQ